MVVVKLKGGLGNQLFQYAMAYSLSMRMDTQLMLDSSFYPSQSLRGYKLPFLNIIGENFNEENLPIILKVYKSRYINKLFRMLPIRIPVLSGGLKWRYVIDSKSGVLPDSLAASSKNIYLDGYFQNEEYFMEYKKDIIHMFTPNYEQEESIVYQKAIMQCNSVAVHVRRGDFLATNSSRNSWHYILDAQYYINALSYLECRIKKPEYYWFSDDIEWVKKEFGNRDNFHFVHLRTAHADIDELMLMSKCRHIITANSTFSWWGAWLNQNEHAIHICPAKRYGNSQMIPDDWIKI